MGEAETETPKPEDEAKEPAKEATWQPELTELKGKLSDLSTEMQTLKQRSQEQATLLQSNQELSHKIQGEQQTILEKVAQLTQPPSLTKPSNEPTPKSANESEPTKLHENISEKKQQSAKPEEQKPPEPPPANPRRRRRSI